MRPFIFPHRWLLVPALLLALGGSAMSQSLLSDGVPASGSGGSAAALARLGAMDLDQLISESRQTPVPPGLYGFLRSRYETVRKGLTDADALAKLDRRAIPALLRAGEGTAPLAEQ